MRRTTHLAVIAALALAIGACAGEGGRPSMSAQGDKRADTPQQLEEKLLGVVTASVPNAATARRRGLPAIMRGALVRRVIGGRSGDRAGLRRGDLITEIRVGQVGWSVESRDNLGKALSHLRSRSRFNVEVFRGPAPKDRTSYATKLFPVRPSTG